MLYRMVYISTVKREVTLEVVEEIIASSGKLNRVQGISGLLLYDGRRFLQFLEGEETLVRALYAKIKKDPRHLGCLILRETRSEERCFESWDMAMRYIDDIAEQANFMHRVFNLSEKVDLLEQGYIRNFTDQQAA